MRPEFSRSAMLLGEENIEKLGQKRVAVFGLGGVGSFAAEALARTGVGRFRLVDGDTVCATNINRQLIADQDTVGQPKAAVMAGRILRINPEAEIDARQVFYLPGEGEDLLAGCDYVIDAVDTVAAKLSLAEDCFRRGIPLISAMGAGNKTDPTRFRVADIFETSVCPLCRVMRRELKRRGIPRLKVVYSDEEPLTPRPPLSCGDCRRCPAADTPKATGGKRQTPGSLIFVPSVCGLLAAREAVFDLLK